MNSESEICKCGCHYDRPVVMNAFEIPYRCDPHGLYVGGDRSCCSNYGDIYINVDGTVDPDRYANVLVDNWKAYRKSNSIEWIRKKK